MPFLIYYILLIVLILIIISGLIYLRLRNPRCGSDFNPNLRSCNDHGKIVVLDAPDTTCDPKNEFQYVTDILGFLEYISKIQARKNALYELLSQKQFKTYPGIFLFAIPELLRVLPTDFGQNQITPYGIVSFYDLYKPCISNTVSFCDNLFGVEANAIQKAACIEYLKTSPTNACPFLIHDTNPNIFIKDVNFFNYIGLLGSISVNYNQVVVMFVDLPVADLNLNYWSFNVYLADSLNPDAICSPYRQVYAASVVPPLNMFTAVAVSGKKFNPLTAQANTVVQGHVRLYLVIALDQNLADNVVRALPKEDLVHIFKIPSAENTMPIDDSLQNPNNITTRDRLFNPAFQRLACFLRLSPAIRSTEQNHQTLNDFIYMRQPYTNNFNVCMVEFPSSSLLFAFPRFPQQISPVFSETCQLRQDYYHINRLLRQSISSGGFSNHKLKIRDTILNIFGPMYHNILNTKMPYKGGYQAIQLAGNAQADNYDANYCLSEGVCLLDTDILVSIAINHSRFGNCIYNNINIVDINKSFGYASIDLDASVPYDYYIVLSGRNQQLLLLTQQRITSALQGYSVKIDWIYLTTGASSDGAIPLCHQLLYVERVYVNLLYTSTHDPNTIYDIRALFGNNLDELYPNVAEDAWTSLQMTTAPLSTVLLKPRYYKVSYDANWIKKILWSLIICIILIIFVMVVYQLIGRKKK